MKNKVFLVTAAGGNGTAIQVLDHAFSRSEYAEQGKQLGKDTESLGAEQAGFLVPSKDHFEMAGGEFCGNATRAAAMLLSEMKGEKEFSFTVSGFDGTVKASVEKRKDDVAFVRCAFPGMPTTVREVALASGKTGKVVDLGGIVHVLVEGPLPSGQQNYEAAHREIMTELGLENRSAVGVIWYDRAPSAVTIHPVVWVRDVDKIFYETSCGSGSIAAGKVTGVPSIIQPTGKPIEAFIGDDEVVLQSEMEVTRVTH